MRSRSSLRLFVAAYPPSDSVDRWFRELGRLELAPHRRVPTEQVHLTLAFLGDRTSGQLRTIRESIERAAAGCAPIILTPQALVTLPAGTAQPPRLVAMLTDSPTPLLELQARLATRLLRDQARSAGFLPHFTLCRFRHEAQPRPITLRVSFSPILINAIVLVRSVLMASGARHEPLESWPLEG
jgi:2'-5' RNA ligase